MVDAEISAGRMAQGGIRRVAAGNWNCSPSLPRIDISLIPRGTIPRGIPRCLTDVSK
jgi:hypothetical protein